MIHLVALPVALRQVWRAARHPGKALLAALYLGWLLQSVLLQHLFDYVQVPPVLLGITVVASGAVASTQPATRRLALAFFLLCALVRFPALCVDRLGAWADCVREGSTPALRDRLSLLPKKNWADLDRVKDFLREQDVGDGELSCMHMGTISLYADLGVRPATRFAFVQSVLVFPRQRGVIDPELASSRQRFMVCDLEGYGMEQLQEERVVFRSGRYVVLRLSGAETPRWLDTCSGR